MPLHSRRHRKPHAKPPLSSPSSTTNPFSTPAKLRESLNLFRISKLPQPKRHLTESLGLHHEPRLLPGRDDTLCFPMAYPPTYQPQSGRGASSESWSWLAALLLSVLFLADRKSVV